MYLLFVDESGTHGGNHPFVLGGLAIHEDDAARLQQELDALVVGRLGRVPLNLEEYELHATELRNAKKPEAGSTKRVSAWAGISRSTRLSLLDAAYDLVVQFKPANPKLGHTLFGVAVDRAFHSSWSAVERERFAYEVLLGKFDVMLKTLRVQKHQPNRGLVIHDRRVVAERDIQAWTAGWRLAAERIGQLRNLADVPLFADSRATRLLQVADLISYAIFRRYNQDSRDPKHFDALWSLFHAEGGVTHGCVHFTPSYGKGSCQCQPCEQRLLAEASRTVGKRSPRPPKS